MMAKTRQQKKKRQRVSADRYMRDHKSGVEFTCYRIPDGTELMSIDKGGLHRFDIMPYTVGKGNPFADEGMLHYERTFWVHRGIGPNNASYVCPAKTQGKKCPICEHRGNLDRDNKEEAQLIKDLSPKERQLWLIVDLDDQDKGVQLFDCSYHLFGKVINDQIKNSDEEDGYKYFADPDDGLTLKIGFDQKTYNSAKFYEAVSVDFRPRKGSYDEEMIDKLPCLDELLIVESYDRLKAIHLGDLAEDDEDDEVEEAPRSRKRKTQPDFDQDDEVDYEDEDDVVDSDVVDEEEDDEEEEELKIPEGHTQCVACEGTGKSSRGKQCRICKGAGHVVAEDEDDDEEEEEEAPKAKRKGKGAGTKASPKKTAPAVLDDDDDDDDDWDAGWDDD